MKVLVAHADMRANGGAESYARAVGDRLLAAGHQVGFLDITGHRPPDSAAVDPALFQIGRIAGLKQLTLWKYALVCRVLPKIAKSYDRAVLSFGEGPSLSCPSLQIRHAPAVFSGHPDLLAVLGVKKSTLALRQVYAWVCRLIAGIDSKPASGVRTITNTRWTANAALIRGIITDSMVLYPKVTLPDITKPQVKREPYHMVSIGRIVPNKKLEEAVEVLDRLRAWGFPATLQIVGRADSAYAKQFLRRYRGHPGLTLNPNADMDTLHQALMRARVGIHLYRSEHFGIAVAEMICAGVLPLVHDSGGVCELVQDHDLRFQAIDDLTVKAADLMQMSQADCDRRAVGLQCSTALQQALDFDARLDRIIAQEFVI